MFERVEYTVARIDGDYAYLQRVDDPSAEEKCVAGRCFRQKSAKAAAWHMKCWNIVWRKIG